MKTFFKMKLLAAALLALSTLPALAQSGSSYGKVEQPWYQQGKIGAGISVTSASAATQLPAIGLVAWICNSGTADAYVAFGADNTAAATVAGSSWLKAGTCANYDLFPPGNSKRFAYVAAISGTSTTLAVETGLGSGPPQLSSSGGGSSGAVFGPTAVGSAAANPPVLMGGTVDGTATGAVGMLKVSGGIAFINCANCTGSGASAADEAAFVAGSSLFAPYGGVFNDGLAALSSGTQAMQRMTAARAGHVNLRNTSGTEIGTTANPIITTTPNTTVTGTITTTQSVTLTPGPGEGTVSIQVTGPFTGTLFVEGSVDGTNYIQTTTVPFLSGGVQTATITVAGIYQSNVAGLASFRIRGSTVATGTATVTLIGSRGTATVMADNPFQVTGYAGMTPLNMQGTVASGSASTANPVVIGMSDGPNAQEWLAAIALTDGVNGNNTGAMAQWYWNGTTYDRARGDLTNGAWVNVKTSVLPTGGATSANQATEISSLATIATNTGAAIPAGSAIIGKVGIDQTTPGTTNAVSATNFPSTVATGTGAQGATVPRVTVATDTATIAGSAPVKGGVGVVNGGSTYNTVAASQTNQALTGGGGGATGDYLSHCVIQPTATSAGTVTILDNAVTVFTFTTGTLSNLASIAVPIGAVSVSGAWKVTTGASETVTCFGKFT